MNENLYAWLVKRAQNIEPRRKLGRHERKQLFEDLPDDRKKQIVKFLAEQIHKNRKEPASYIVKAKGGCGKGQYTYTPSSDELVMTEQNEIDNAQAQAWKRAWLLGCIV